MAKKTSPSNEFSSAQQEQLFKTLRARFEKHAHRHKGVEWAKVQAKLESKSDKLRSLFEMERTGGEPDVVSHDKKTGEYVFMDCSPQTPAGRRSICYDHAALKARKEHPPKNSAMNMAAEMGVEILSEEQYRMLQTVGEFDTTTSSWVDTPAPIRKSGGAIFCDRRYNHVFTYHNGADSYYAARGFRAALRV